jgi:large subunit ribosomal protein L3
MTPALLGKKIGMTRVYNDKGAIIPVTVVQCAPNHVTQVKSADGKDGYNSLQLGFEDIKPKFSTYPLIAHTAKVGVGPKRHFAEIRQSEKPDQEAGAALTVGIFDGVQYVDVIGTISAGSAPRTEPNASTARRVRSPRAPRGAANRASPKRASAWPAIWVWIKSRRAIIHL